MNCCQQIREHSQQLGSSPLALSAEEAAPGGALDQLLARHARRLGKGVFFIFCTILSICVLGLD